MTRRALASLVPVPTALLAACTLPAQGTVLTAPILKDVSGLVRGGAKGAPAVRVMLFRNDMQRGTVDPIADGRADADGKFAFHGVPWPHGYDWGFNTVVLVARTGDAAVGMSLLRGDKVDCSSLAVELTNTVTASGIVHDASGAPIRGATVWPSGVSLRGKARDIYLTAPLLLWHVSTDEHGRFALKGMPAGASLTLVVVHPDHAEARPAGKDSAVPFDITLDPGSAIAGTVRMPDGSPAARVSVCVQGHGGRTSFFGRTQSDGNGHYVMRSLPGGIFNVWAEADGLTVVALHAVAVETGKTVEQQDLGLVAGGFIVGRVVDAKTSAPVQPGETADVAMQGPARPNETGCQCEPIRPDGTFRIRALAGTNYLYLRPGDGGVEATSGMNIEVVEGKETQVVFKAQRGRSR